MKFITFSMSVLQSTNCKYVGVIFSFSWLCTNGKISPVQKLHSYDNDNDIGTTLESWKLPQYEQCNPCFHEIFSRKKSALKIIQFICIAKKR